MIDLPLGLQQSIETGQCVLFLGAGVGFHLSDSFGDRAPLAGELAEELADHFGIDADDSNDLTQIATVVELRKGRAELETYIKKRLSNLEPDEIFKWLFTLRWRAIFTTNYDNGIQRAYDLLPNPPQRPIVITSTPNLRQCDPRFEVPVYHLHGSLFTVERPHIVITEDDYAQFREQRRMLFELLKQEFATSTIVYIGYSNRDNNWKIVLSEMAQEFYPSSLPRAYRIAPSTPDMENEILRSRNIETINANLNDFRDAVRVVLAHSNVDGDRLQQLRDIVPSDLKEAFDKNPAAVSRLLSSWEYVNQSPFNERPNIRDFLRGDRPNWGLIGSREIFERDIEEEIYNDLLDYATSTANHPSTKILLASAGYGVTTLMMCLAASLVREHAGPVFMLKPGQAVIEGDIEFACSLFTQLPFFIIDNAADHASSVNNICSHMKDAARRALFFLGERINEWRQAYSVPRGDEYELEDLSDPEIYRLLDYLEKNSELNALEPLSPELRYEAIRQKHGKDLLVTLRESTEGKSFDAILEDEFWGIHNSKSRQAYLIVCCFYQYGGFVRDKLLADMLEMSLTELYDVTGDATAGVIRYDLLDASSGSYGARARHRVIAAVVWERCGSLSDRESILQLVLDRLNLNYKSDKEAFDNFIRSDRLINDIGSLEAKIRFFDRACQKDPLSPYVRQHYSRMLLRSGLSDLALQQIDQALDLNPGLRVLYHTKGHILSEMALSIESLDIARRRMAQSESSFNQALSMNRRDDYCYQGLSRLYFGWARRVNDESEQTQYITKAEEIISQGLRSARVRDSLWIVSAEIQDWLDDQVSRIGALEKAVQESPNSPIARYLLARAYRKQKKPQKALAILDPVLRQDVNEFRITTEYAIAQIHMGKPYAEAIAILNLSTLYGYSDSRFIATLGGMLFLNGEFSKSEVVFNEARKRNFSSRELNTIQFRPPDPSSLNTYLKVRGTIVTVKAGYALVDSPNYPRLICPGSKFAGLIMKPGMQIEFEIAFNARGPLVDRPQQSS